MPKVNLLISINNEDKKQTYKTKGILIDNYIKYTEEDNTKVTFNIIDNKLIRENKIIRMTYLFDNNKSTIGNIFLKEMNKELELNIITNKLDKIDNNILIEYVIDDNVFEYMIEVDE